MKNMRWRVEGERGWVSRLQRKVEWWLFRRDWGPKKRAWLEEKSDQLWTWRLKRHAEKLLALPRGWDLHMACFEQELRNDHRKLSQELYKQVYS